jgi:hypothetical protein
MLTRWLERRSALDDRIRVSVGRLFGRSGTIQGLLAR